MAVYAFENPDRGTGAERSEVAVAHPRHQRFDAKRAHVSRRNLQIAASRALRAGDDPGAAGIRSRFSRYRFARGRAVEGDPSVQGVRVDFDAALPLAVFVLSEPCARPNQRLD